MAYKFKTSKRKSIEMSHVRTKGGEDEVILRKSLWHKGVRYRTNYKALPGKPDIAITKYKIAVFVDGEFWHGYNWKVKKTRIKKNRDYWIPKIEYNMRHDREVNKKLEDMGWIVLRFWSEKVLKNPEYCSEIILWYIRSRK